MSCTHHITKCMYNTGLHSCIAFFACFEFVLCTRQAQACLCPHAYLMFQMHDKEFNQFEARASMPIASPLTRSVCPGTFLAEHGKNEGKNETSIESCYFWRGESQYAYCLTLDSICLPCASMPIASALGHFLAEQNFAARRTEGSQVQMWPPDARCEQACLLPRMCFDLSLDIF